MRKHTMVAVMATASLMLGGSVARAQEAPAKYVSGQFGLTMAGGSSWFGAGEVGTMITPFLGVYGGFGRLSDGSTADMRQAVDTVAAAYATRLDIRSPLLYGVGGIRVAAPLRRVTPYAVAGIGVARISPRIRENGSDVTEDFETIVGFETSDSGRVLELGGGVQVPGPVLLDVGYRYLRLGQGAHVSRFHAGVGLRF